jgi:hypothetical protein
MDAAIKHAKAIVAGHNGLPCTVRRHETGLWSGQLFDVFCEPKDYESCPRRDRVDARSVQNLQQ